MGGIGTKIKERISIRNDDVPDRFLVQGFRQSGKTCLMHRLKFPDKDLPDQMSLIYRDDFEHISFEHDGNTWYGWDENGGRRLEGALLQMYFKWCRGFVYVIDSADKDEFCDESLEHLDSSILKYEGNRNKVVMVVANKQDLEGAMTPKEIEKKIKADCTLNRGTSVFVMPVSCLTGEGIQLAFDYFWTLMSLKEKKALKPGLLPKAWKNAESQLEKKDFSAIVVPKKKDCFMNLPEKKKKSLYKVVKGVLNY